jgi:hypothetical protein
LWLVAIKQAFLLSFQCSSLFFPSQLLFASTFLHAPLLFQPLLKRTEWGLILKKRMGKLDLQNLFLTAAAFFSDSSFFCCTRLRLFRCLFLGLLATSLILSPLPFLSLQLRATLLLQELKDSIGQYLITPPFLNYNDS